MKHIRAAQILKTGGKKTKGRSEKQQDAHGNTNYKGNKKLETITQEITHVSYMLTCQSSVF